MDIKRRGFLGAILAAGVAPAFVGSQILMPVRKIIVPDQQIAAEPLPEIIPDVAPTILTSATLMLGDKFTIAGRFIRDNPRLGLQVFTVKSVLPNGTMQLSF